MQVFKLYFKIIRSGWGQIVLYIGIFLSITVLVNYIYGGSPASQAFSFSTSKPAIALVNEDGSSSLLTGFSEYLGEHANLSGISAQGDALRDALFFHAVDFVVRIPKGFTEAFLKGETPAVETAGTAESANAVLLRVLVDRYFGTAALYVKYGANMDEARITALTRADLRQSAPIRVERAAPAPVSSGNYVYVFNYMAYTLFSALILGVASFMLTFNQTDLKRRNLCSPLPATKMSLQMFLGNMVYGVVCWAAMAGAGLIMFSRELTFPTGFWLCLNAFLFTLACLGISFLLGMLIRNRTVLPGLQNTLALGMSFLSGVFVPQAILGKTVLAIASFTPAYWYVRANHAIVGLQGYGWKDVSPILGDMLILAGFGAAALAVSLAISKRRGAK